MLKVAKGEKEVLVGKVARVVMAVPGRRAVTEQSADAVLVMAVTGDKVALLDQGAEAETAAWEEMAEMAE